MSREAIIAMPLPTIVPPLCGPDVLPVTQRPDGSLWVTYTEGTAGTYRLGVCATLGLVMVRQP